MKRKLLLLTMLAFCILLCKRNPKVSAAQYQDNESYAQKDLPIVTITTENNAELSTDKSPCNAKVSVMDEKGTYTLKDMDITIRLRGNSSLYVPKSSYKMKFQKKQNLLNIGDGGGKNWGLIANYYDASLLRNMAAYNMASMLTGSPYAIKCRSVDVYMNGDYQGAYLLTELIDVNKNRVNIKESVDEVEGNGYLLQMTGYAEDFPFTMGTRQYEIKSDLSENQTIQNEQHDYISHYVETCMTALQENSQAAAEKYIDIDSLVDNYIGNEIAKNLDVGWDSFYLYKDAYGKLTFGPMWDFDLAFGNTNMDITISSYEGFNPHNVINSATHSNPWFTTALTHKWFRVLVQKRFNELKSNLQTLPSFVTTEAQKNYNSYNQNFQKWSANRMTYFESYEIARLHTFTEHYTYLSNWIDKRISWLSDYFNTGDFISGLLIDSNGNVLASSNDTPDIPSASPVVTPTPTTTQPPVITTTPTYVPTQAITPTVVPTTTPTVTPTTTTTVTPTSPAGGTVKIDVSSDWNSGAICNITVTNQSGKNFTNGWTLEFDFDRPIASLWSANLISNTDGHCIIANPDWQKTLANGESYTFGCQVGAGDNFEIRIVSLK